MIKIRVVKLGGSLLSRRDWPERLRGWFSRQPECANLLVVGGGDVIESIRQLDRVHDLSSCFAHWLCIDLLSHTAQIAGQLLPEFPIITAWSDLQQWLSGMPSEGAARGAIVDVAAFYSRSRSDARLPENWSTTSDSLAALLSTQVGADEMVLFKSTSYISDAPTATELADAGVVDAAFPKIVPYGLLIRIVNLAGDDSDTF